MEKTIFNDEFLMVLPHRRIKEIVCWKGKGKSKGTEKAEDTEVGGGLIFNFEC